MRDNNLAVALRLARAGFYVFPVSNDRRKRPLIRDWDDASSRDPEQVQRWWRVRRGALAAIDLRKAGLVVIDADRHGGPDGVAAWHKLLLEHDGEVSACPLVRTPNDGLHIYFTQIPGEPLRCRSGSLPPAVECKGEGGSITAPGNIRGDGTFYETAAGHPDLLEAFVARSIPPVPAWLCDMIRYRPPAPEIPQPILTCRTSGRLTAYAQAALRGQIAELSATPSGGRNNALNLAAYRLGRMAARGWIGRGDVESGLRFAAQANGLLAEDGPQAISATINSGFCAGLANPAAEPRSRRQ